VVESYYPVRSTKPTENKKTTKKKKKKQKKKKKKKFDPTTYCSAIGNILFLAVCARLDILFSVSKSAKRSANPSMEDWKNVLKIFK